MPWEPGRASTCPSGSHIPQTVCFTTTNVSFSRDADGYYKFIWIDTDRAGHKSDGHLFAATELI